MIKKIVLVISGSIVLTSCNSGIEGEGAATAVKEFEVESFSQIEANCNCDINIIPAEANKVVVESHQNLIDNLEIKNSGKELIIKEKQKVSQYDLLNINLYVTPNLEEIELNRQAKMKIAGTIKSNELKIKADDQSSIHQSYLDIKNLELDFSGQSIVNLSGTAIQLDVETSNEAQIDLSDLQSVEVKFNAEDNSSLKLNVMKDLRGQASDNAQVSYTGDPNKDTTEKGRALINKK